MRSDSEKADVERAYHYHFQDTWDALSEMYEEVYGSLPDVDFDLLTWFLVHFEMVNGKWVYIKALIH